MKQISEERKRLPEVSILKYLVVWMIKADALPNLFIGKNPANKI